MADNQEEEVADYQDDDNYYREGPEGQESSAESFEADGFNNSVAEMEEELENLTKMQQQVEKQITSASDKLDETSV